MQDLSPERQHDLDGLARRHGVSPGAARTLLDALVAGGGAMAQFNVPELGGMGQWSQGGMTMVGDMFDRGLKARVDALCTDLAFLLRSWPVQPSGPAQASGPFQSQGIGQPGAAPSRGGNWWPAELGTPSTSGAQNDLRYAYFPNARRLAVEQGGRLGVYDTGDHRIGGVSQQQGGTRSLAFTSQHGPVPLDSLPPVGPGEARPAPSAAPAPAPASAPVPASAQAAAGTADDPLAKIKRLAELRQEGILTDEEFAAAKAEQLRRL